MLNIVLSRHHTVPGWVGTKKALIRGGRAPKSDPLPLYMLRLAEMIIFSYTFH